MAELRSCYRLLADTLVCYTAMAAQAEEREPVTAWLDGRDRERLVELARSNERSVSAELRLAVRAHVRDSSMEGTGGVVRDVPRRAL